jgi:large subunit ribosomal protein L15
MPLVRRIPKRGFHSPFRTVYQIVNLSSLEKLSADGKLQGGVVNPDVLAKLGVVKKAEALVKVLGNGEMKAKLDVSAHAFSASAAQKIEAAGGKVQRINATHKD